MVWIGATAVCASSMLVPYRSQLRAELGQLLDNVLFDGGAGEAG